MVQVTRRTAAISNFAKLSASSSKHRTLFLVGAIAVLCVLSFLFSSLARLAQHATTPSGQLLVQPPASSSKAADTDKQQAVAADSKDTPLRKAAAAAAAVAGEIPNRPIQYPPLESTKQMVIAYAVSVTGCGSDPITEGAAVLKHSIHINSLQGREKGGKGGRYDYAMYAIYHPTAEHCAAPLADLGYTLLPREVFVKVSDIRGEFLKSRIEHNGCCGEKELIKLEAYTLTDHPIFVHLDLDVLVIKPLDELFDMMLFPDTVHPRENYSHLLMWPDKPLPTGPIHAFFTMDYNMVRPATPYKPVQGGFLVARPDLAVYKEFQQIVLEGDFREHGGWGGLVGPFHGSMTFQGIVPYYYNVLHTGQSIELNRCIYNQMADNPRTGKTVNDIVSGECRTGQVDCEDCRSRPFQDVVTTHFTLCQKPWWCLSHSDDRIQDRLCRQLTREWYRIRSDLETSWGRPSFGQGDYDKDEFFGFCHGPGKNGYSPIQHPFGQPVLVQ